MDPIEALRLAASPASPVRPWVTLSYAQSLDGSLAAWGGAPLALSGPDSLRLTHRLRAAHAAILVGGGTVLADNPRLNVRLVDGPDPQPVVLDTHLRIPTDAKVLHGKRPAWIACAAGVDPARRLALEAAGAQVLPLPRAESGGVSLPALLEELGRRGVASLMVEGGARVIAGFLAARLADYAVITIAPVFVAGLPAIAAGALPGGMPRLAAPQSQVYGEDLVVWGKVVY
jgi:3,4-dihydroxy 2-butanone 4-phosphate synthase/GTP cyclohydrolase II